jgi:hypothetical protein
VCREVGGGCWEEGRVASFENLFGVDVKVALVIFYRPEASRPVACSVLLLEVSCVNVLCEGRGE